HRHLHAVICQRLFEIFHNAIAVRRRGVDRHQIVVVKVDAISTEPAQLFDHLDWTETRARGVAERITPAIAHGPESESEFVFRTRLVNGLGHAELPIFSPLGRIRLMRLLAWVSLSGCRESVDRHGVIALALSQHGRRKLWLVRRIRIVLSFETKA